MATRIRNKSWEDDQSLEEVLQNYNRQGYQRKEMSVSVEDVKSAINKELMGPGRLLGYRTMHLKIKNIHGLNVPQDLVYAAMTDLDSDGLKMRQPGNKNLKKKALLPLLDRTG